MKIPEILISQITKSLTDEGRIIEAGWEGFRATVIPRNANDDQVTASRTIFFAGASYLLSSIMQILDPGSEATEADLERMNKIHAELSAFEQELLNRIST